MSSISATQIVAEIDADVRDRLVRISAALGRPLRVLHMGNIANNAYVNAKIMRAYGIEADVVVLDYYHVMGCPEWEEGVIEQLEGTQNDPDWGKTKIGNFRRPEWFLQGPVSLIAPYLTARAGRKSLMTAVSRSLVYHNIRYRGAKHGWRKVVHNTAWKLNRLAQKRHVVKFHLVSSPLSIVKIVLKKLSGTFQKSALRKIPDKTSLAADIASFQPTADRLREAFNYYDVVQGYAVDGIYPLLGGKADAYACYEHGTLRDIPYQDDMLGRICAYTYQNAPAVFITNTDCVASADKLGIPRSKQFPIPHGFDSFRADRFRAEHASQYKPNNRPVTFIAPARHHWKNGAYVSWLKGNDVPILAAKLLADEGFDFKIIVVRWGQEVGESEALIAELGVGTHFEWIEPVAKARLWQYYLSCNGVLDQFVIPAIGGVSFETLALGRPLFTRIDEPVFDAFFGRKPPLVNVHTPEGLAAAMSKVIREPAYYDQMAKDALEWGASYHSSQRILQVLLNGYARFIPSAAPANAILDMTNKTSVVA